MNNEKWTDSDDEIVEWIKSLHYLVKFYWFVGFGAMLHTVWIIAVMNIVFSPNITNFAFTFSTNQQPYLLPIFQFKASMITLNIIFYGLILYVHEATKRHSD